MNVNHILISVFIDHAFIFYLIYINNKHICDK